MKNEIVGVYPNILIETKSHKDSKEGPIKYQSLRMSTYLRKKFDDKWYYTLIVFDRRCNYYENQIIFNEFKKTELNTFNKEVYFMVITGHLMKGMKRVGFDEEYWLIDDDQREESDRLYQEYRNPKPLIG